MFKDWILEFKDMTSRIIALFIALFLLENTKGNVIITELNQKWQFKQARRVNWYNATVPGVVHTDLMDNNIIADPFIGYNERACQWVDKEDWEYKTSFDVSDEIFAKDNIVLKFKGLDTYADVFLNETKILSADNMFREWTVDCKALLKKHGNVLRVYFNSPIKIGLKIYDSLPYHYPAIMDMSENGGLFDKKISPLTRKAPYQYGWDWSPRLVTSGIWRPVFIEAWDKARISDVQLFQFDVCKKSARIKNVVEITSDNEETCEVAVINNDNNNIYGTQKTKLTKGLNKINVEFTISNPNLWWTNGLGTQYLYPLRTILKIAGNEVDSRLMKTGIRSIKLVTTNPDGKSTLHFEVNGVPVFMKGANCIPFDNFLPRVTNEKYEKSLHDARDMNMNMLRVWGGGIYENDIFYDLCDKYGILVWQDFMFSCSMYPADSVMINNIRIEAVQNVKRIRNHACLALWCGNNEIDAFWNDGWQPWKKDLIKQSQVYADKVDADYKTIFNITLPQVVNEYDPQTTYRESSPVSGNGAYDMHYYDIWYSKDPDLHYSKNIFNFVPLFMSEYGFQGFPDYSTILEYVPDTAKLGLFSESVMFHQRVPEGTEMFNIHIEKKFHSPKDFKSLVYVSQILQAEEVKIGQEWHRRNMPTCMGTLYWQLNDCWPASSWSGADYYGHWKALNYYNKHTYSQILVSPFKEDSLLKIYVISDKLSNTKATLTLKVIGLDGSSLFEKNEAIEIPANTSKVFFSEPLVNLLKGKAMNQVVVYTQVSEGKTVLSGNTYLLAKCREIDFPEVKFTKTIKAVTSGYEITLSANSFAKGVKLEIADENALFSDNYFDLIPGISKTFEVTTSLNLKDFEDGFKVISMRDSY